MVINLLANGEQIAGTIDTNGLIYCQTPGIERYRAQFAGHRRYRLRTDKSNPSAYLA
jgi:hypothetical protein